MKKAKGYQLLIFKSHPKDSFTFFFQYNGVA
jgi:hypothetical protein